MPNLLLIVFITIFIPRLVIAAESFDLPIVEEEKGLLVAPIEQDEETQSYVEFRNRVKDNNTSYDNEDSLISSRKLIRNNIYQNNKIRIYNNIQYDLDEVKDKYQMGSLQHLSIADFSLSLGYGIEYQLKLNQWIGYEYLSAFPNDYGQSIRLFWRKRF